MMLFNNKFSKFYLRCGHGVADSKLESFDKALLDAKVGDYNLIKLSSVLPPRCYQTHDREPIDYPKGSLIPIAYTSYTADTQHPSYERIAASIAVALPEHDYLSGLIMESSDQLSEFEKNPAILMAQRGMNFRNRSIKSIPAISISYDYTDIICKKTEINSDGIETIKSCNCYRGTGRYLTLFACCILGL